MDVYSSADVFKPVTPPHVIAAGAPLVMQGNFAAPAAAYSPHSSFSSYASTHFPGCNNGSTEDARRSIFAARRRSSRSSSSGSSSSNNNAGAFPIGVSVFSNQAAYFAGDVYRCTIHLQGPSSSAGPSITTSSIPASSCYCVSSSCFSSLLSSSSSLREGVLLRSLKAQLCGVLLPSPSRMKRLLSTPDFQAGRSSALPVYKQLLSSCCSSGASSSHSATAAGVSTYLHPPPLAASLSSSYSAATATAPPHVNVFLPSRSATAASTAATLPPTAVISTTSSSLSSPSFSNSSAGGGAASLWVSPDSRATAAEARAAASAAAAAEIDQPHTEGEGDALLRAALLATPPEAKLLFLSDACVVAENVLFSAAGESFFFGFECRIPPFLPPSFSGRCVKIKYFLSLAAVKTQVYINPNVHCLAAAQKKTWEADAFPYSSSSLPLSTASVSAESAAPCAGVPATRHHFTPHNSFITRPSPAASSAAATACCPAALFAGVATPSSTAAARPSRTAATCASAAAAVCKASAAAVLGADAAAEAVLPVCIARGSPSFHLLRVYVRLLGCSSFRMPLLQTLGPPILPLVPPFASYSSASSTRCANHVTPAAASAALTDKQQQQQCLSQQQQQVGVQEQQQSPPSSPLPGGRFLPKVVSRIFWQTQPAAPPAVSPQLLPPAAAPSVLPASHPAVLVAPARPAAGSAAQYAVPQAQKSSPLLQQQQVQQQPQQQQQQRDRKRRYSAAVVPFEFATRAWQGGSFHMQQEQCVSVAAVNDHLLPEELAMAAAVSASAAAAATAVLTAAAKMPVTKNVIAAVATTPASKYPAADAEATPGRADADADAAASRTVATTFIAAPAGRKEAAARAEAAALEAAAVEAAAARVSPLQEALGLWNAARNVRLLGPAYVDALAASSLCAAADLPLQQLEKRAELLLQQYQRQRQIQHTEQRQQQHQNQEYVSAEEGLDLLLRSSALLPQSVAGSPDIAAGRPQQQQKDLPLGQSSHLVPERYAAMLLPTSTAAFSSATPSAFAAAAASSHSASSAATAACSHGASSAADVAGTASAADAAACAAAECWEELLKERSKQQRKHKVLQLLQQSIVEGEEEAAAYALSSGTSDVSRCAALLPMKAPSVLSYRISQSGRLVCIVSLRGSALLLQQQQEQPEQHQQHEQSFSMLQLLLGGGGGFWRGGEKPTSPRQQQQQQRLSPNSSSRSRSSSNRSRINSRGRKNTSTSATYVPYTCVGGTLHAHLDFTYAATRTYEVFAAVVRVEQPVRPAAAAAADKLGGAAVFESDSLGEEGAAAHAGIQSLPDADAAVPAAAVPAAAEEADGTAAAEVVWRERCCVLNLQSFSLPIHVPLSCCPSFAADCVHVFYCVVITFYCDARSPGGSYTPQAPSPSGVRTPGAETAAAAGAEEAGKVAAAAAGGGGGGGRLLAAGGGGDAAGMGGETMGAAGDDETATAAATRREATSLPTPALRIVSDAQERQQQQRRQGGSIGGTVLTAGWRRSEQQQQQVKEGGAAAAAAGIGQQQQQSDRAGREQQQKGAEAEKVQQQSSSSSSVEEKRAVASGGMMKLTKSGGAAVDTEGTTSSSRGGLVAEEQSSSSGRVAAGDRDRSTQRGDGGLSVPYGFSSSSGDPSSSKSNGRSVGGGEEAAAAAVDGWGGPTLWEDESVALEDEHVLPARVTKKKVLLLDWGFPLVVLPPAAAAADATGAGAAAGAHDMAWVGGSWEAVGNVAAWSAAAAAEQQQTAAAAVGNEAATTAEAAAAATKVAGAGGAAVSAEEAIDGNTAAAAAQAAVAAARAAVAAAREAEEEEHTRAAAARACDAWEEDVDVAAGGEYCNRNPFSVSSCTVGGLSCSRRQQKPLQLLYSPAGNAALMFDTKQQMYRHLRI